MEKDSIKGAIRQALLSSEEPIDIETIVEYIHERELVNYINKSILKKEVVNIIKDCLLNEELVKQNGLIYTVSCTDDESDTVEEEEVAEVDGDDSNEPENVSIESGTENEVEGGREES